MATSSSKTRVQNTDGTGEFITLSSLVSTGGVTWSEITASQTASVNNGYICNSGTRIELTLPSTAVQGDKVALAGKGTGGWKIKQNAGQTIHAGNLDSVTGSGGEVSSTLQYDAVELVCVTDDTDWVARQITGVIDIPQTFTLLLDDWDYYYVVTNDSTKIPSDLTNYVGMVDLSDMPAQFWTDLNFSDGREIRTALNDGSTQIPSYVSQIDTGANTGILWYRYTGTFTSGSDPELRIYVGNSSATALADGDTYGRNDTFQDFEALWDFAQDPSGTAPQLTDLTGNGLDGTSQGGMASGDLVTLSNGLNAWNFDRANSEYVDGSDAGLTTGSSARRIGGWMQVAADGEFEILFDYGSGNNGEGFLIYKRSADDWAMNFTGHVVNATLSGAGLYKIDAVVPTGAANTGDVLLYINGTSVTLSTAVGSALTLNTVLRGDWHIGSNRPNTVYNNLDTGPVFFQSTAPTADYLETEYNNQNSSSTFYSVGSQQANT